MQRINSLVKSFGKRQKGFLVMELLLIMVILGYGCDKLVRGLFRCAFCSYEKGWNSRSSAANVHWYSKLMP